MGASDSLDSIEISGCLKVRLGLANRSEPTLWFLHSLLFGSLSTFDVFFQFIFFELCGSREDKSAHGQFSSPLAWATRRLQPFLRLMFKSQEEVKPTAGKHTAAKTNSPNILRVMMMAVIRVLTGKETSASHLEAQTHSSDFQQHGAGQHESAPRPSKSSSLQSKGGDGGQTWLTRLYYL